MSIFQPKSVTFARCAGCFSFLAIYSKYALFFPKVHSMLRDTLFTHSDIYVGIDGWHELGKPPLLDERNIEWVRLCGV